MASVQMRCGPTCRTVSSPLILSRNPKLGKNKLDIKAFSPQKQGTKVIVLFRNTQDSLRMILRSTRRTFLVVALAWQHTVWTSLHLLYKSLQFLPYGRSIGSWICLTHKTYTCHTVQNTIRYDIR
jgi:hypothetical protein